MIKLQFAMDSFSVQEALAMLERVQDAIDIVEIGTPMLLRYGLEAVRTVKRQFPALTVLSDAKIMDGGRFEADCCFESGADIVTVMALANPSTIRAVVDSANAVHGLVLADMMNVPDIAKRSGALVAMGVDYICVHNASDVLDMERAVAEAEGAAASVAPERLVIAGGINPKTVAKIKRFAPAVMVVGSAIANAADPRSMAQEIRRIYQDTIV